MVVLSGQSLLLLLPIALGVAASTLSTRVYYCECVLISCRDALREKRKECALILRHAYRLTDKLKATSADTDQPKQRLSQGLAETTQKPL